MGDSMGVDRGWTGASCAYLSFHLVNDAAQLVHTLAMCDMMTVLGIDAELLLAYPDGGFATSPRELREQFGLENEPRVSWTPLHPNGWIAHARLFLESYRAGGRHEVIYTRKALFALGALLGGARHVILEYHQLDSRRHRRLAFALARHSRRLRIVCISRRLAKLIAQDYGLDESSIIVEHTGTSLPIRYDHDARHHVGRRLVATYVGTFAPGRGLETIFAMADRCPEVDFVVVGGESPVECVPANVDVRGRVAHGQVQAILAQADILLMPYTRNVTLPGGKDGGTGEYCSPLKMFEYLSAGRPIIASPLPSIIEILVDGSNALLADELSVDEWVDALRSLASDPELRTRLARGAAETAERHTLERRIRRIFDEVWSRR